ncbi:MAG: hypothetical protein COV45_03355 [Deltaproteobacteria bacterium CG11_big_fil_rev_8_21_14_0_20_47_16]|nr:MAG: hypothetical protein COV45_03355 [Deltaproteobacteria bacterium CG11_big_fil_rev_8_21_14_0_20_47_16]
MAPSRTPNSASPKPRQSAEVPDVAGDARRLERQQKAKPNSGMPLTDAATKPDPTSTESDNFPRFGNQDDHDTYVEFLRESFHAKKEGDMALRIAKAMKKFVDSVWGLSPVRRSPMEPPDEGDIPDIAERSLASAAGTVSTDANSYGNPFDNHYNLLAQQAQQGATSVYS